MTESAMLQLGVGGIFALMILKTVFDFVGKKRNGVDLRRVEREVHDLHNWHDVNDPDTGAKIWYSSRSMSKMLDKLGDHLDEQTKCLQRLCRDSEEIKEKIDRLGL